ncbi:winged helix-turn-helix domain-containing protein [Shewanella algae]|uniref:nSTAND1 domain-containing NTPase n=1 Tax=Shewanella algae TaxID=38313 RepID=UPI000F4263C6|nr:winged helix-turn-helix domain-containing protein [Shewanella algae]AYV15164.1 transcriptional regulator [Shewanella algae]
MSDSSFFLGDWQVDPGSNSLRLGKRLRQLEPKAMNVLLYLCRRSGEVVSSDELLDVCWPGSDTGDNPLHKTINQLRRALDDKAGDPSFIETIRKRGYRVVADVRFPIGHEASLPSLAWNQGSPFPGLKPFSADYAGVFFGRSEQINALLERIARQIKHGRGFCLLLGPSGSGKSSLINAGILPNLASPQGFHGIGLACYSILDLADVAEDQLLLELAAAMLDWELDDAPVLAGYSAETLAHALEQDIDSLCAQLCQALPSQSWQKPRFGLFVDRLEVLLSSPRFSAAAREQGLALFDTLARSGAVLLLSACRNEFYPQVVASPSLMAGKGNGAHFDLLPPSRQELLQMIRLPAAAAGLSWEFDPESALGLDELLCREAASNPDALPMLQYMLQALYLQRSDDNQLQLAVYHRLGGLAGAIGQAAEDAIASLSSSQRAALPRVLSLLVTLREDEQSVTSRSARYSELATDAERALVQALVDSRLFVSHLEDSEPGFSIAHEALLRRWSRARDWIDSHREGLAAKARLFHQARRWQQQQCSRDFLLPQGKPLTEALALKNDPLLELDPVSESYVAASSARGQRQRRLKGATFMLLCLLTLISVFMSYRSVEAEQQAQAKRLAAEDLLGFMVGDFADKLRSIGRMDLLDGVSNKALDYFREADSSLSEAALFRHGQTLEAMGEVAYSRGRVDEAEKALLAARDKLLPLLSGSTDQLELLKTLGANAFWLGQLKYDQSDWQGTRPWFEAYLQHSLAMYQLAPDNSEALMELSYAHNSLGSLSMELQDFSKARQGFEESLRLKLIALAESPDDPQRLADVANARSWLASAASAEGDIQAAIAIHKQIAEELKWHAQGEPYQLYRLSGNLEILAQLYRAVQQTELAKESAMEASRAIAAALEADPENERWRMQQSFVEVLLVSLLPASTEKTAMLNTLNRYMASEPSSETSTKQLKLEARFWLAAANERLEQGDYQQAQKLALLAEAFFTTLGQKTVLGTVDMGALAEAGLVTAYSVSMLNNDISFAYTHCQKVGRMLQPWVTVNRDARILAPYAMALDCMDDQQELLKMKAKFEPLGYRFRQFKLPSKTNLKQG